MSKQKEQKQHSVAELDDDQLTCRTYGHAWTPNTVRVTRGRYNKIIEYTAELECARCFTERRQVLSPQGEIVRNGYTYAEGYLMPKGSDRKAYSRHTSRMAYMGRFAA